MDASTKIFLAFRLKIWKIDRNVAAVDERDVQNGALRAPRRSSSGATLSNVNRTIKTPPETPRFDFRSFSFFSKPTPFHPKETPR